MVSKMMRTSLSLILFCLYRKSGLTERQTIRQAMSRNKSRASLIKNHGATDVLAILPLAGLVLLSGLIISLYTLVVTKLTVHTSSQDALDNAALAVAERLSMVSVNDPVYGRVGVCDLPGGESSGKPRVTSLNRIYGTLRLDEMIAKKLSLQVMSDLVGSDLSEAQRSERKLRKAIVQVMADFSPASGGMESAYKTAFQLASKNRDAVLLELRIKVGTLKPAYFTSGITSRADKGEDASQYTSDGQYRANVVVPVAGSVGVNFYPVAQHTQLCDPYDFEESGNDGTPSVVLVEAVFKSKSKPNQPALTRTSCAIAGGGNLGQPASAFMVSFPHGMPPTLHSLSDMVTYQNQTPGQWLQAAAGDVPGSGHLVKPTSIDTASMAAAAATEMAFYDWLRSLGPEVDPDKVSQLFGKSWVTLQPADSGSQPAVRDRPNSALVKDTGARSFALLHQSGANGGAQLLLRNAFAATANADVLPHSAIPLQVDADGVCNLPGHRGFDRQLITDFLQAVYETNLASSESASIANSIITRLTAAHTEINHHIVSLNEELNSVNDRILRLETPNSRAAELASLRLSQAQLKSNLETESNKIAEYGKIQGRAATVLINANKALESTFNLGSNVSKYAERGIFRLQKPEAAFLLSKTSVFMPATTAVDEDDIYRPPTAHSSRWLAEQFAVLEQSAQNVAIDTHNQTLADGNGVASRARFIVFDSRQITTAAARQPLALSSSPFGDSGIPAGQLVYYAQDALRTGKDPQVGWSVLIRDAVSSQADTTRTIISSDPKWCQAPELNFGFCPSLAVEVQVRSPVPFIPNLPVGSDLINPKSHEKVSQIPPMPAEML